MTIPEMAPYIYGTKTARGGCDPYRIEQDLYNEAAQLVHDIGGAQESLDSYEKPKWFYESNPDIAHVVPQYAREEIFYALKNGYANTAVPAKVIFMLTKAYRSVHNIPNLIFKAISEEDFNVMFQEKYLNDVCAYDVIKSFLCEDYIPITDASPIQMHKDYAEVYIEDTDMVAAIPTDIAKGMSVADVKKLKVTPIGICLEDIPLRTLGGRYGAANSIYDLRECL